MSFKITPRKIRFTAVSTIATAIDFGLLLLITNFTGLSIVRANYISSSAGFIYSFFANKKYTFRTPDHHIKREVVWFLTLTLFGIWVIQPVIIHLIEPFLQSFHLHGWLVTIGAKLVASLATFVWNYYSYTRIVFKKTKVLSTEN